ncbi:MAG: alpha/beta hydrolase, partial [Caulobacteraceae bacterium]|nr:alpha/beta hydrolase [Caulobacter sp.]
GFVVLAHDWRGQGLSDRLLLDPLKGHARGWRAFVADARMLLDRFAERLPKPWFGLGHSMGGGLLALSLVEGEDRYAGAILSAPMLGVRTGQHGPGVVRAAAMAMSLVGRGSGLPLPTTDPLNERFEATVLTHDRRRFERTGALLRAEPSLRLAGPTWSWLAFAFAARAQALRPGGPERVSTPVLALLAGDDRLVLNDGAERFVARVRDGRALEFEGAWHELLMEGDATRSQVWAAMDGFVDALAPAPPG